MPPKVAGKKEAPGPPDNSGMLKQDVEFKFNFTVVCDGEAPPYAVMFEWFGQLGSKTQRYDTSYIQTWTKTDLTYSFEKTFDPIRVENDFCTNLTTKRFYVYFVNGDTNKVQESYSIDYSGLLNQGCLHYNFETESVPIVGISKFQMKLTADKQLLQDAFRGYLNPFAIEVIAAKETPSDTANKFLPAYVKYQIFDGSTVETQAILGKGKLQWNHVHVFLAGLMDPDLLKQKIRSQYLRFELHDRDELVNEKIKPEPNVFDVGKAIGEELEKDKPVEQDPKKKGAAPPKKQAEKKEAKKEAKKEPKKKDAKLGEPILPPKQASLTNNYGVAAFYLVDFLKPAMRSAKYKSPVVPVNKFEDLQSGNVDLNTTARGEMQKVLVENNYFSNDTSLSVNFSIAIGIGTFVKPPPPPPPEDPKKKVDPKQAPPPAVVIPQQQKPKPKNVFERVIYLIPYKDRESLQKIEAVIYQANMKAFKFKDKREISTHLLTPADRNSIDLDYLTSLQLIDPQGRLFIVEGLLGKAINKLHEAMPKATANTRTFKILKNSNITFTKRLYTDFNLEIKRIRFRPSLNQILLDPSIYIHSKVPEEICQNLNKVGSIRKVCNDLASVESLSLWPSAHTLIAIERKYSQSLSTADITGADEMENKADKTIFKPSTPLSFVGDQTLKHLVAEDTTVSQPQMNQTAPPEGQNSSMRRYIETKTFAQDTMKAHETFNLHLQKTMEVSDEPVYMYSGQRLNQYQRQQRQLRQKMQKDKNYIYTYGTDHLSLTLDPYKVEEVSKAERDFEKSLRGQRKDFDNLLVKTKDQRMRLPKKPSDEDSQCLKQYPYHQQKEREKELKKSVRDLPLNNGKDDFKKYIKKPELFSEPKKIEAEVITPVQRDRLENQRRVLERSRSKEKNLGGERFEIKIPKPFEKATGLDKYSDIRDGPAQKRGLIDIHKTTHKQRTVDPYGVSLFQQEKRHDPAVNPLVRKDEPALNVGATQFNNYQRPEILTKSLIAKPLKSNL